MTDLNKHHGQLVFIRGAGDLATGVAHRLHRCGFRVVMTELAAPTVIRRPVSFARAIHENHAEVEGVTARKLILSGDDRGRASLRSAESLDHLHRRLDEGMVVVVVDPHLQLLEYLSPQVFVEATLSKKNFGLKKNFAPLVIALGPGFMAGLHAHAVIETKRGHDLGRIIYDGQALPNDGIPGDIQGHSMARVVRAPDTGFFQAKGKIGAMVAPGDILGSVNGVPVLAEIPGVLRGLIYEGSAVGKGMKIGDIDPRGKREYCFTISDKARTISGGVLEAILAFREG